jgi:hypothetical protein
MVKETMMQNPKRQAGMTMWSLLFVLGTLAFIFFLFAKLFSPYMDDLKIKTALESLARQPDAGSMTVPAIQEAVRKRLEIDSADSFDLSAMTIETKGRTKTIRIKYEAVVPMAFNISALLSFDHAVEVRASE